MQPDPQETRLQSPEHVTGNRGRLGAASAPRRQRTAFPPRWQGSASGRPLGRRKGGPWSLPVPPVLDTRAGPLRGEDTRCESGLSGSMGEAGKTGHVCVRPCGPHLRVSETSRRCNPADAGAVPFPARGQLPRMCRRAEGARRRAGTPCRAATPTDTARRRPPRPRTCSPNLRRQQALLRSHGTGNVAAVPAGLWSSAPSSAAEP